MCMTVMVPMQAEAKPKATYYITMCASKNGASLYGNGTYITSVSLKAKRLVLKGRFRTSSSKNSAWSGRLVKASKLSFKVTAKTKYVSNDGGDGALRLRTKSSFKKSLKTCVKSKNGIVVRVKVKNGKAVQVALLS